MKKTMLLVMLVIAMLSSCQSNAPAQETISSEETSATVQTETETTIPEPQIEAVDYNGDEINFVSAIMGGINLNLKDVKVEELTGEIINDAIFYRNEAVSEKYNVKIQVYENEGVLNVLRTAVTANDDTYDIGLPCISDSMSLALNSETFDLNTIPHIDFQKPWWNGNVIETTCIYGQNYFAIGDLNILSYEGTGVMMFSKALAEKSAIPDLYETVLAGDWTFDLFAKYSEQSYVDLNGNGEYDENDQYGFTCNGYGTDCLALSTDIVYSATNKDGMAVLTYPKEAVIDHVSKIVTLINNENITLFADRSQYIDRRQEIPLNAFLEDRVLFYTESMSFMHLLRTMESDFGLIPFPKRNETQDTYYSFLHNGASSAAVLPVTVRDQDQMGRILEDLYYQSYLHIRPAYYESTITGKIVRDTESEQMLDYILRDTRCDLAQAFRTNGLGILNQFRSLVSSNSTDVASMLASSEKAYQTTLDTINETMQKKVQ